VLSKQKAINLLMRAPAEGVNVDGIRAVVAQIYLDPAAWNQNVYFGQSFMVPGRVAYCFAAWTCLLVGMDVEGMASGDGYLVHSAAQHMLGLTRKQANQIFWWGIGGDEHPTVEELRARITEVTGVLFESAELTYASWAEELASVGC